jgi:hypothetical protein
MARVTFTRTADGGRSQPTPPGHFSCPLEFRGEFFDCRLDLTSCGPISPGQSVEVPISFLCPELVETRMKVGDSFLLWEGKTIAVGNVTKTGNAT